MTAREISKKLRALADSEQASQLQRFFKTAPGQYGAGDRFLGIRVPQLREEAKNFTALPPGEIGKLLSSGYHEERLCALLILVRQFSKGGPGERQAIYEFYLQNTRFINNWDLVDLSAPLIVGAWLAGGDRRILYRLAGSQSLWERRIAMISTFAFIKRGQCGDALAIAELLLADREDLISKAAGWMLREVGKRDPAALRAFLDRHGLRMPRTMLRYAIEKFPEEERQNYLRRPAEKAQFGAAAPRPAHTR